jgi:hypothetical protein
MQQPHNRINISSKPLWKPKISNRIVPHVTASITVNETPDTDTTVILILMVMVTWIQNLHILYSMYSILSCWWSSYKPTPSKNVFALRASVPSPWVKNTDWRCLRRWWGEYCIYLHNLCFHPLLLHSKV